MTFAGKTALVTGGTAGIGLALARGFAARGASLILVARDPVGLAKARRELEAVGAAVQTHACDLADAGAVDSLCARLTREIIHLDVLVNNAGVARFGPFAETTDADYDLHFALNVRAIVSLTRELLPALRSARGCVLNVSSYFARRSVPATPSALYSASKGAVESLTRALAVELGPDIRINAIAPGTIATPLVRGNLDRMDARRRAEFERHIDINVALGRVGEADELVELALTLCGPGGSYLTGGVFAADGGLTAT